MRSLGDCAKTPSGYGTRRAVNSWAPEIFSKSDRLSVDVGAWHDRVRWFVENISVTMLVLAQNPGAFRHDTLRRHRVEAFLLRDVLEHRYGVHSREQAQKEPHKQ